MRTRTTLVTLGVLASALWLSGCSTFEDDWQQALASERADDGLTGPWVGTWTSEENGHTGALRGIVTPAEEGGFVVRYHATYVCWSIFDWSFEYDLAMEAERRGDEWSFAGEADLGWLAGGVYRYEGTASGGRYHSTYEAESDHGVFELERPAADDEASGDE